MTSSSPIDAGRASSAFSAHDRTKYLLSIGLATGVLLTARALRPSPSGVGTHEQMGLPPCPFLHFTGFPCPSCGLTTSFAHAAHLQFFEALLAQPVGLLTFLLTLASIPFLAFLLARRVPWETVAQSRGAGYFWRAMIALYAVGWVYKIVAMRYPHLAGW